MKFAPYTSADDALLRQRLIVAALSAPPLSARSSLLIAPAGYGKTTLLSHLQKALMAQGSTVIWLNCTDEDRDPDVLLTNISHALRSAGLLDSLIEYGVDDLMDILSESGPLALVIDEYENAASDGSDAVLENIIRALPLSCRLFIASRELPQISLAKLRVDGSVRIVNATELRFTDQEMETLLPLSAVPADYGKLLQQSEGWPVMVQLAKLNWQTTSHAAPAIAPQLGHSFGIFDYLAEQILNRLAPDLRDFLLELSILSEVDIPSAQAVTKHPNTEKAIYSLLRLRPIVTVIDEHPLAIRLHPLFRDFLRHEFLNFPITSATELHQRAARYFANGKDLQKAIHHASQSGSEDLVAEILEDAGGALLNINEGYSRTRSYLATLPPSAITHRPRLHLMRLMQSAMEGTSADWLYEFDQFLETLASPENQHLAADSDFALSIELVRGISELAECPQVYVDAPWPKIDERHRKSLARKFEEPRYYGQALILEFLFLIDCGSLQRADQRSKDLAELFQSASFSANASWIINHMSIVNLWKGNLSAAEYYSQMCLDRVRAAGETRNTMMRQYCHAILGECYFEQNKLDLALRTFDDIPKYLPYALLTTMAGYICTASRAKLILGDVQGALADLIQGHEFACTYSLPRMKSIIAATVAEIHLSIGNIDGCEEWIVKEDLRKKLANNQLWFNRSWLETHALVRLFSRYWLHQEDFDRSHDLAHEFSVRAQQSGRSLVAAYADVVVMECLLRKGSRTQAQVVLRRILDATAEHAALRPLLDMSAEGINLLRFMARKKGESHKSWIDTILTTIDAGVSNQGPVANDMSPREREVLQGLELGHSTKIIARTLDISHETVRHHLKKIYAKLDVHNRDEAVQEAKRRGILI